VVSGTTDPRAAALASYLEQRAAAFSMSADINDEQYIADAGMALLDAAELASGLRAADPRLTALSELGRFESMPGGTVNFVETAAVRAAMQRPLSGGPVSASDILALLVTAAEAG
jgi:hypothetical protein